MAENAFVYTSGNPSSSLSFHAPFMWVELLDGGKTLLSRTRVDNGKHQGKEQHEQTVRLVLMTLMHPCIWLALLPQANVTLGKLAV